MKKIGYVVFIILFSIAFLCSTQIVANLYAKGNKFEADDFSIYHSNSRATYSIETIETYEDLKESFCLSGWAFCETERDNPEKTITIILKGRNKTYSFTEEALIRRDVRNAFSNLKLPSMRLGMEINVSTLEVKDDIYDLYLYVWENEENYGLVRTGIKVEKSRDYFDIYRPGKVSVSDQEFVEDEHVKCVVNIEDGDSNDAVLKLNGWGFIEDADMQECDLYLVLVDDQNRKTFYETNMCNRLDVAKHFQDERYALSGWSTVIENLPDAASAYTYTVAVKKDGIYHVSPIRVAVVPPSAQETTVWQSEVVNLANQATAEKTIQNNMESFTVEGGMLCVIGWGFQPELDCAGQSVYLSINGATYTTQSNARPDVAEAFENENYTMSGYRALIPMEDIPERESEIRLLVENGGELYSSASITVIRKGDNIQKKA